MDRRRLLVDSVEGRDPCFGEGVRGDASRGVEDHQVRERRVVSED